MKAGILAALLMFGPSAFAGGEIEFTQLEYCETRYYRTGDRVDPFTVDDEDFHKLVKNELLEISPPEITFTGKSIDEPMVIYHGNKGEFETIEQNYYASLPVKFNRAKNDPGYYGPSWIEGYQMIDENAFSVEGTTLVYSKKGKKIAIADLRGGRIESDGHYDNYCKVIDNAHDLFTLKIVKGKLSFFQRIPGCTNPIICTEIRAERESRKIKVQLK